MSYALSMKTKEFDLLILGAGSGGIAMAERAAALGAKVAIIEMQQAGGTCVNLGCVPKKIMWYAGSIVDALYYAPEFGFKPHAPTFDFATLVKHRNEFTNAISQRMHQRLLKNKITYLQGCAHFVDDYIVKVDGKHYGAKHIVVATGCESKIPAIKGAGYGIDSDGFFGLQKLPQKIAIIGNGYIAMELAGILQQLGSSVKVLIRKKSVLSNFDSMISKTLAEIMTEKGIELLYQHDTEEIIQRKGKLDLHCKKNKKVIGMDTILFAIGRTPRTHHLNLTATKIKTDASGYIKTNKWETTNLPHIHAIGDITGKKQLTPVAIAAGRKLATRLFGNDKKACLDYANIPTVIFSHPPVGSVGLSDHEAIAKYGRKNLTIYQSAFGSLYTALSSTHYPSKMRLITVKKSGKVVGCHIIGPNADEMLQGFAVAIKMGATKADFDKVVAIHPTSAEELVTMKPANIEKSPN